MLFPFSFFSKKSRCIDKKKDMERLNCRKVMVPFTHSHSQIDLVAKYILSQEEHHKKRPFREEYLEILEKNEVQFKDEYVFEFFNDIDGWD